MRAKLLIGLIVSLPFVAQNASADTRIGIAVGLPVLHGLHIYDTHPHYIHDRRHHDYRRGDRHFSNNWRHRHDRLNGYGRHYSNRRHSDRQHFERRYTDRHYYEYDQPRRRNIYGYVPNFRKQPKYCR